MGATVVVDHHIDQLPLPIQRPLGSDSAAGIRCGEAIPDDQPLQLVLW
jgi:hypothetical protein